MPGCCVASCHNWNGNTKNKNIKYFPFPKDTAFQQKWLNACNSDKEINVIHGRICSCHFTQDCFMDTSHLNVICENPILKLRKDAIPTLHLTESSCKESRGRKRKSECERDNVFDSSPERARSSSFSCSTIKDDNVLFDLTNQSLLPVSLGFRLNHDESSEVHESFKVAPPNFDQR